MNKQLEEAIAARDKFLAEKPHLKEFQAEIDRVLEMCKPEERAEVLLLMLAGRMNDLKGMLEKLNEYVQV